MTSDPLPWLAIVAAAALVAAAITGLLVSHRLNRKIESYESIEKALKGIEARRTRAEAEHSRIEAEVRATAVRLESSKVDLQTVEVRTRDLVALEVRADEIHEGVAAGTARLDGIRQQIETQNNEATSGAAALDRIQGELDLYSRLDEYVQVGFFEEPDYLYETSERYSAEIKKVRDSQKEMIKNKLAVETPGSGAISIDGAIKKGKAVVEGQIKMMLRTFNIDCDLLIGKVKPSNLQRTLERIEKNAEVLEKLAISLQCGIAADYVALKYEECALMYEYRLRKQEEQEEQRLIREQMREEERARREYQAAIDAAEKEERLYRDLLDRARGEMNGANEEAQAELAAKIAVLEEQLREAEAKEERAKSLAEQTRKGHVYIISNVGSFGENVYKIGMTRRLDPMDRVKELGDASVPFQFDVHAIVYADDAPGMETALHRKFSHRRVNAVNLRKEFFRVGLDEVRSAVEDLVGPDLDFHTTILAEEYYESLRLQGRTSPGGAEHLPPEPTA